MMDQDDRPTCVTLLPLDAPAGQAKAIEQSCDQALALGYRLAAAYPHQGRLVLVFQKDT